MCSFDRGFLVNYCLTHIMYHQVLSFTLMCLVFYRQSTPDRRTGIMGSGKFIDTIITPNVAHINVKLQKCSAKFFFFFFFSIVLICQHCLSNTCWNVALQVFYVVLNSHAFLGQIPVFLHFVPYYLFLFASLVLITSLNLWLTRMALLVKYLGCCVILVAVSV